MEERVLSAPKLENTFVRVTTGEGAAADAPGAQDAKDANISVSLVRQPSGQEIGIISVLVPKETATAGTGFNFPLPSQLARAAEANSADIQVTTITGKTIPSWLKFDPATKSFTALAVPDGAFPMQVVIVVGSNRWIIVIAERQS